MPIKLEGQIKDDYSTLFTADIYYDIGEVKISGINFYNITDDNQEFNPNKGACIWRLNNGKNLIECSMLGWSKLLTFRMAAKSFRELMPSGFFTKSSYDKITSKLKKMDFNNYFAFTDEQIQAALNRTSSLMQNWNEYCHQTGNTSHIELNEYFWDNTGLADYYEGIQLIENMARVINKNRILHPARLWFNAETGRQEIGPHNLTILLKMSNNDKIKSYLHKHGIKYLAEMTSRLWNNHTMKEYYSDYENTILKEIFHYTDLDKHTKFNHHIIITDSQIPDDWYWKDGDYYLKKNNNDMQELGLIGSLLGC